MSFDKKNVDSINKSLKLNQFKRIIKKAIDTNELNKLSSNIIFAYNNIKHHTAYTQLATQNIDDLCYGITNAGKSYEGNNIYLFRYTYTNENLNNNLYYIEIKDSKVVKIKYIDNFFFPKELIEIRKILSWDNNYVLMDISAIICGNYGDTEMFENGVGHGNKFNNFEGFLPGPNNKNKG